MVLISRGGSDWFFVAFVQEMVGELMVVNKIHLRNRRSRSYRQRH